MLLILLIPACSTFKKGIESEIEEDGEKILDKRFAEYHKKAHSEMRKEYMEKVTWVVGTSVGLLTIISGFGGTIILYRKLKKKNGNGNV